MAQHHSLGKLPIFNQYIEEIRKEFSIRNANWFKRFTMQGYKWMRLSKDYRMDEYDGYAGVDDEIISIETISELCYELHIDKNNQILQVYEVI
ncbi:hypothetical protein ACFL4H_00300 [Candidatus Neomarinimicrobiota bacterium]